MNVETKAALREFLLAFADDEHLMGQQHTEWIGVAPFLEEDLAFSSIGQDELGHAVMLYELVCELDEVEPTDAVIDALAYDRGAVDYRSCALTEFGTTDWAEALVRHWIYDTVEKMRWDLLATSSHAPLAELVQRVEREERYHRMHADALLDALLQNADARQTVHAAVETVWPMVAGLLAPVAGEAELIAAAVTERSTVELASEIEAAVAERFELELRVADAPLRGADRSDHFAPLMARMREVIELDLTAAW